jgi:hypothetical protein
MQRPGAASSLLPAQRTTLAALLGDDKCRYTPKPKGGPTMEEQQTGVSHAQWEEAKGWAQAGVARADILTRLRGQGLDEEAARIVLNSLPGAPLPQPLPELNLDLGQNTMAPGLVSPFELGMTGNRRMLAVYYLAFGLVLATLFGSLLLALEFALIDAAKGLRAAGWLGFGLGALALGRGLWLVLLEQWPRSPPVDGSDFRR